MQQFFLARHYPDAASLRAAHEAVAARELPARRDKRLQVALKLLKDGALVKQNRRMEFGVTARAPRALDFERLAAQYQQKQERDREALEQMVAYAQSGYCRWKLLLDYFGDDTAGVAIRGQNLRLVAHSHSSAPFFHS